MERNEAPAARPFQRDLSAPWEERSWEVGAPEEDQRLDRFLTRLLRWRSRVQIRALIEADKVQVLAHKNTRGGEVSRLRPSTRLRTGQLVRVRLDAAHVEAMERGQPAPGASFGIRVLFEDDDLLAVDKPAGVSLYPTRRHPHHSFLQELHQWSRERGAGATPASPCHRLDRETSGLLLLAKNRTARANLGEQFEARSVRKNYVALVQGIPAAAEGRIDLPIGPALHSTVEIKQGVRDDGTGQAASTEWRVSRTFDDAALLELQPRTGRQHQLRVHCAAIGHPILGDRLYLGGDALFLAGLARELTAAEWQALRFPRLALHAWRLEIDHPRSGDRVVLEAPPVEEMISGEGVAAAR